MSFRNLCILAMTFILLLAGIFIYRYNTPHKLSYYEKRYDKVELVSVDRMSYFNLKDGNYYVTYLIPDSVFDLGRWWHKYSMPTYKILNPQDYDKLLEVYLNKSVYMTFDVLTDSVGWNQELNRYKFAILNDSLIVRYR